MIRIDIRHYYRTFVKKSRAVRAQYLNLQPIDVFLIVAVVMALVYIAANRSCAAVREPQRINVVIDAECAAFFGRDTVDALVKEFEARYPHLRIREGGSGANAASPDIVFFDDRGADGLLNGSARPLVSFMDVFMYNIDLLKAASLDRPPKTRAEFLAAARAVAESKAGEAFALGLSPQDPLGLRRDFYPWLWAVGVDIDAIDLAGDAPVLPRAVLDAVALMAQLHREKLLAPGTFEKTGPQRLDEFAAGKIAMITASARDVAVALRHEPAITLGITALPAINQGKNRLGISSIYAGIGGSSAVPEEAGVFLAFLAEKSDLLAETLGAVPGRFPGSFAGDYIQKNEWYAKAWDIFAAADIVEYRGGGPHGAAFDRLVREKLAEALQD